MKKTITLNEAQLNNLVAQAVKRSLNEMRGPRPGGGPDGMGNLHKELHSMRSKAEGMSPYDPKYDELWDKVERLEDQINRLLALQKGGRV